ncbi:MAG TPA: thioredoxin family protein [Methanocellaceae archaeon]
MGKGFLSVIALFFCTVLALVLMAGCVSLPVKVANSTPSADPVMGRFDADLANGPVFIEFGASWCDWCTKERPVIDELTREYPGVRFYNIDADNSEDLVNAFYVNGIPQMNVIAGKNADGTYVYIDAYGNATNDRKKSGIIGYTESDQLKQVLDAALGSRK